MSETSTHPAQDPHSGQFHEEKCTCPKDEIPWHNNPECPMAKAKSELDAPTGLAVVALRKLIRRERIYCNAFPSYVQDCHYLQYQTSDGKWHDAAEAFEDTTGEAANSNSPSSASPPSTLPPQIP